MNYADYRRHIAVSESRALRHLAGRRHRPIDTRQLWADWVVIERNHRTLKTRQRGAA